MAITHHIEQAVASIKFLAKDLHAVLEKVDTHGDWHIPVEDFNLDYDNIQSAFWDIKNPTQADKTLFGFMMAMPEWLRYAVLDCCESGDWK